MTVRSKIEETAFHPEFRRVRDLQTELRVLKKLFEHHVKEEKGPMFKMARKLFDKDELDELGNRLMTAKEEREAAD